MDILNSAWLISMLQKSGKTSRQRLLSLFDILADWVNAPLIRETINLDRQQLSPPGILLNFLTEQAEACGAKLPEALAQQLYFIALSSLHEELRTPGSSSIRHAKQAAQALIDAQTQNEPVKNKPLLYGLAASFFVVIAVGSMLFLNTPSLQFKPASHANQVMAMAQPDEVSLDPAHTAEMYASIEQMRNGDCHFPEALQLPDAYKKVYMEIVVGGQVSSNPEDQALAKSLMQKVHCNYAPMLMRNSTG